MPNDTHERARDLVERSAVEGLTPQEQRWLDGHLSQCGQCSQFAELSARAVRALGGFAFQVDPGASLQVQQMVRARAEQLAASPAGRLRALAFPIALGLTVVGSMAMWQVAGLLAARWNVPPEAWHAAFVAAWVVPSAVVDGLLWMRGRIGEAASDEGELR